MTAASGELQIVADTPQSKLAWRCRQPWRPSPNATGLALWNRTYF